MAIISSTRFKLVSVTLLIIFLFAFSSRAHADLAIQLVHKETNELQKPIVVGSKVVYALTPVAGKTQPESITGILNDITSTTATVNGVTFNLADLKRFGAKNPKAFLFSALLSGVGLALIRAATAEPQKIPVNCAGCQPVSVGKKTSNGGKVALIGAGVGLNGLALYNLLRNPSKDLKKYSLEIIEI